MLASYLLGCAPRFSCSAIHCKQHRFAGAQQRAQMKRRQAGRFGKVIDLAPLAGTAEQEDRDRACTSQEITCQFAGRGGKGCASCRPLVSSIVECQGFAKLENRSRRDAAVLFEVAEGCCFFILASHAATSRAEGSFLPSQGEGSA